MVAEKSRNDRKERLLQAEFSREVETLRGTFVSETEC